MKSLTFTSVRGKTNYTINDRQKAQVVASNKDPLKKAKRAIAFYSAYSRQAKHNVTLPKAPWEK